MKRVFFVVFVFALCLNIYGQTAEENYQNGFRAAQQLDLAKAFELFSRSAEQGHIMAQTIVGECYLTGLYGCSISYDTAMYWLLKAAEQGSSEAQYNIGVIYFKGLGQKQSFEKAGEWYLKAAEQGYVEAQYNIAAFYEYGWGVEQSCQKSVEWLTKAAQQGHTRAQYSLGKKFFEGRCTKQSYKDAVKWLTPAAEAGDVDAQYILAVCYRYDLGVKLSRDNYSKALELFEKAAAQGDEEAKAAAQEMKKLLNSNR